MKKTMFLLLILSMIGYSSFGQKKRSFKIDTVYFEKSPFVNLNRNISIDSLYFNGDRLLKLNGNVSVDSIFFASGINNSGLFSREETDFSLTRKVHLSNNSGSKNIVVEVTDKAPQFLLSIQCNLESGVLAVEIYDPKGNKRGNFSVKGDSANDKSGWSEVVEGFINKRYSNPMKGDWTIKFISTKVTADIIINTKLK